MKIHCFSHYDIDGLVSYLVLKRFHKGTPITYTTSQAKNFREDWLKWTTTHKVKDYDII